jgi:hypothetical protein
MHRVISRVRAPVSFFYVPNPNLWCTRRPLLLSVLAPTRARSPLALSVPVAQIAAHQARMHVLSPMRCDASVPRSFGL